MSHADHVYHVPPHGIERAENHGTKNDVSFNWYVACTREYQ